jgi:hypothetical protein
MPTQPAIAAVVANADVVADLNLIVELDAVTDQRVVERTTVDRRIGADLDVVTDQHATDLRDLDPALAFLGEAETVATDHRAGVDDRPLADHAAVIDDDVRVQQESSPIETPSPITQPGCRMTLSPRHTLRRPRHSRRCSPMGGTAERTTAPG